MELYLTLEQVTELIALRDQKSSVAIDKFAIAGEKIQRR